MTFLFGPRNIRMELPGSVICAELHVTDHLDVSAAYSERAKAIESQELRTYRQEVGRVFGGKVFVEVIFKGEK